MKNCCDGCLQVFPLYVVMHMEGGAMLCPCCYNAVVRDEQDIIMDDDSEDFEPSQGSHERQPYRQPMHDAWQQTKGWGNG